MPKAHDVAIIFRARRHLKNIRQIFFGYYQRMVSIRQKGIFLLHKTSGFVMPNHAWLAMHQMVCPLDFSSKCQANSLVAQADTQNRDLTAVPANSWNIASIGWMPRPRPQ